MSIKLNTISDGFREQIGKQERVVAAVFTTYRFEPEFFEQEVIPLMLDQGLAFSSDQRIKSIQVREALSTAELPLEVFYDLGLFHQQATTSPSMEYLHHGIHGERRTFHAKLVFLLLEDTETGVQSLRVGAGSANLTFAGWWENIECQHWEHVVSGRVSRPFLNQLRREVAWLASRRSGVPNDPRHALPRIDAFLTSCRGSNDAALVSYYGLGSLSLGQQRRPAFMRFLRDALSKQSPHYKRWTLEIISPYFADSPEFDGHEHFFNDLGVQQIRIFLPVNDQGEALCNKEYYDRITQTDRIQWAVWSPEISRRLGLQTPVNRTTHAKIYHFYNGMQSWVFIGSVNFTHRATTENQEAGFLVRLPVQITFLSPLNTEPDKWCVEDELPGTGEESSENATPPDLILNYDWKRQRLTASLGAQQLESMVMFNILSTEGEVCVAGIRVGDKTVGVQCDVNVIEGLLKNSGLLQVSGCWLPAEKAFPAFNVMVQQVHWTHKPLDLPLLSPQEIIQIYAGLSQIHRNQIIEQLKQRQLHDMGLVGESAQSQAHDDLGHQFFAEYAELFHAFRNLRRRLDEAKESGRDGQVDYYLSGCGMDALPTLLNSLEDDRRLDHATIYLTLLCLIEIYKQPEHHDRPRVRDYHQECWNRLRAIETSGQMRLISDDAGRTRQFFDWYREQFFRNYRPIAEGDDNAAH